MAKIIAQKIMDAGSISPGNGQDKYRSYFVTSKRFFGIYKDEVDAILTESGYADVIIA